jgi:hypothetical protein
MLGCQVMNFAQMSLLHFDCKSNGEGNALERESIV